MTQFENIRLRAEDARAFAELLQARYEGHLRLAELDELAKTAREQHLNAKLDFYRDEAERAEAFYQRFPAAKAWLDVLDQSEKPIYKSGDEWIDLNVPQWLSLAEKADGNVGIAAENQKPQIVDHLDSALDEADQIGTVMSLPDDQAIEIVG